MKFDIVTIFPQMVKAPLAEGIVGRAIERGVLDVAVYDLRDFATDRHRVVDDVPFGGGPGMVMKPEPLFRAVEKVRSDRGAPGAVVLTTPDGQRLTHSVAARLRDLGHVTILCGRYEGVDERVRQHLATEEISVGDYVLSGGELAALVIVDAVARLVPGVVGDEQSVSRDSFATGLLDFPQYTRPAEFDGMGVPPVLISGHHGDIERWRRRAALARTLERRPDLLEKAALTTEDQKLLEEIARARHGAKRVTGGVQGTPPIHRRSAAGERITGRTQERRSSKMTAVETVERANIVQRPAIKPGDTVRVHVKVREGDKERIQVFEGMVIGMHRGGARATFTVRKVSFGQGVERIFPLHSPIIDKIDVLRTARVRRAKLYFLRELKGKAARMREQKKPT